MLKIKLLLVFCLSALLSGCFTPMSLARVNKEQGNKGEYYSYTIATGNLPEKIGCKASDSIRATLTTEDQLWLDKLVCPDPSQWVVVYTNFYGLNGQFVKANIPTPKAANVQPGDIIKFSRDTTIRSGFQFLYIAAKANERDAKKCDWVGSKILNYGGVECEGWSYKNMPVFQ